MNQSRIVAAVLTSVVAVVVCGMAWAQRYPDRPVRIVVPYVVGGNLDLTARLFGQALSDELGQPFVIDNRPGANGNTGTEQVVRATADGYTLAMVSAGTLAINPALYKNMGFDPEKDLAPISIVASGPMVLEVNTAMPFKTMPELIAYAKANPGKLNFGSGGNGTLAHLSTEMLRVRAGIDIVHVPYKGTSLATTDVMAGHISGWLLQGACSVGLPARPKSAGIHRGVCGEAPAIRPAPGRARRRDAVAAEYHRNRRSPGAAPRSCPR